MKILGSWPALAGLLVSTSAPAITLDDILFWTGSGTNRAALVIEWNSPEVFNNTTVPGPVANKTLAWGYRFNGAATGTQMFNAVVAADPRLYAVEVIDPAFGAEVRAIGYNLDGSGLAGVADGTVTDQANAFTNGVLTNAHLNADAARSLNGGDLFWSGFDGPYWQLWNELGDNGGFAASPNRGTNEFWDAASYTHGQWASASAGLDDLPLTNGSWIGFSVSAAGYDSNTNDAAYNAFNLDEQAPPSPDGTYAAYVCNTNDFAVQIVATNNIDTASPYNNPAAALGRPTLEFLDYHGTKAADRTKIVEAPYWTDPDGNDVITEISSGGQLTVRLGRRVYDDPNNPYGVDLIVYGNSFFSASGFTGLIGDGTDLDAAQLGAGFYGHATTVSVSQDGTNWFAFPNTPGLYPDNAYRWDETNHSWTDEQMNPTKPLNPSVYAMNFSGQSVAGGLGQFIGAAGGSGYDLKTSGLPWIQYVRVQPGAGTYTVIDAIAAVNPVVMGDDLAITPDNLASGITNLVFQNPSNPAQTLLALNFGFVSETAKITTMSMGVSDFSSLAPVAGAVSSAYQVAARPVTGTNAVAYAADIGLRAGGGYAGNGADLRVYQWGGTNWRSAPFAFDAASREATVAGVTNFSAFVVSQIIPPQLQIAVATNGFALQFTPVPNCAQTLERSADLAVWTPVATVAPTNSRPYTIQDIAGPPGKAFYRLRVSVP